MLQTFKALTLQQIDDHPEILLTDKPLQRPGAGEVLVKLTSAGLNRADTLLRDGRYFFKPDFNRDGGCRMGFEGAGIVEQSGPHCRLKAGDRVAMLVSDEAVMTNGCLAQYGLYREDQLLATPDNISDALAGSFWMAYLTAWGGMVSDGGLKADETVIITAASSSVGLAAMQMAEYLGTTAVVTTTSADKVDQLKKLGAAHVINTREEDYVARVMDITAGRGSDLVFDAVAGPGTRELIKASTTGGRLIIHGRLDPRPMDIHSGVIMKRQLMIKGFIFGQILNSPALMRQAVDVITQGINNGALNPIIAARFSLDEFQQAFELLESNQQIGKIVINPWPK